LKVNGVQESRGNGEDGELPESLRSPSGARHFFCLAFDVLESDIFEAEAFWVVRFFETAAFLGAGTRQSRSTEIVKDFVRCRLPLEALTMTCG
jgi:hypothetical protein